MLTEYSRKKLGILALGFGLAASGQVNAAPENFPLKGKVVAQRVTSKEDTQNYRDVSVDCGGLIAGKQGTKDVLILSVAFISNFDTVNSPAYMAQMDDVSRNIIMTSRQNFTVAPTQVKFMMGHVNAAHGVRYEEIREGFKKCEALWLR